MEDLEVRLVAGRMLRRGRDSQGRVGDLWRTARSLDEDEEELTMENGRTVVLMLSQTSLVQCISKNFCMENSHLESKS